MSRSALSLAIVLTLLAGGAAETKHDKQRHPPSRLFISPMGEPFRSDLDGDPEAAWFNGADRDHDGRISLAEFQADAQRWFRIIDRGHDGEIDPDDIDYYENQLVPEIRVADAPRASGGVARPNDSRPSGRRGGGGRGAGGAGPGGGGGAGGGSFGPHGQGKRQNGDEPDAGRTPVARSIRQGAAHYSYLDFPEPLTAADANQNRGVDLDEMLRAAAERFELLDKNGDGFLERRELPRVDTRSTGPGPGDGRGPPLAGGRLPADRDRQLGGGDREED